MLEHVLFVDDDQDLRDIMHDVLETLGVRNIVSAGSLREVRARRDEACACQLAILDVNLGTHEPTGVAVYDWLMSEGFNGTVVFLTGHANNDPRVQDAAKVAGSTIVSKPLPVAGLRGLLEQAATASTTTH